MQRASFYFLTGFAVLATAACAQDFKVGTQLVYSHPSVSFETNTAVGAVQLAPHSEPRPGFEFRYRRYGFSFSTSLSDATSSPPQFLSGGLTDARTYFHGDAWGVEAYHRRVKGFYAQAEAADEEEIYHPQMKLNATSITLYRAVGEDSRVYRLSEGLSEPGMTPDVMFTFGVSQNHLRDEEPFLNGIAAGGSRFQTLHDFNLYSASFGAGFALSTNAGGIYFDPALFAGFGVQYREWNGDPETTWNLVKVNLRMRLGYRGSWFDAGAGFENDAHAALSGNETAIFNALVARALVQVYL